MKKLVAYCLEWHVKNSDAFRDMLVEPLKSFADIELRPWDGNSLPREPKKGETLIFCMLPPSEDILARKDLKIIWLPMWDQAQDYTREWWDALPKNVRVVAFSDVIHQKASEAKLSTLRITYYKNPDDFSRVTWGKGPVVFYWNRTGMIGPLFIEKLCASIKPSKLLFLSRIDPRIEDNKFYELPKKLGDTEIITLEPSDRNTFLKRTISANILIAPRLTEGVGMTFLESMCRGGVVMAHDAPTMSEYITNGRNGILIDNSFYKKNDKLVAKIKNKQLVPHNAAPYLLTDQQDWKRIANINLESTGNNAYKDHVAGFREWEKNIKKYADYVLNW